MSMSATGALGSLPPGELLVVEDDPSFGAWLARTLAPFGTVRRARSLAEARHELARPQARFRVAVVDLQLPDGSGLDLHDPLLAACPRLLLTSLETQEVALAAVHAGATGYVLRSASSQQLSNAVRDALAGTQTLTPMLALAMLHAARLREPACLDGQETRVLRLMSAGCDRQETAQRLALPAPHIDALLGRLRSRLQRVPALPA